MKELLWTTQAIEDRESIYAFIEADNPAAALALDTLFGQKSSRLGEHPNIGRNGRVANTREWVLHSNYILVYDIVDTQVRVLRLLHTARAHAEGN